MFTSEACLYTPCLQEIDELLGQNLTAEDEDAIAAELESILAVSFTPPQTPSTGVEVDCIYC